MTEPGKSIKSPDPISSERENARVSAGTYEQDTFYQPLPRCTAVYGQRACTRDAQHDGPCFFDVVVPKRASEQKLGDRVALCCYCNTHIPVDPADRDAAYERMKTHTNGCVGNPVVRAVLRMLGRHDKLAQAANFDRCGCEDCAPLREAIGR